MPPASRSAVLEPKLLAATRGLTLAARQLVAGLLPGLHPSRQPGMAREFAQFRAYQPGDEPRHIDWKLYARSDRYFVRESEIETAVIVRLIVDATASMQQTDRGATRSKFDHARALAAALALLAQAQGDPVRLHIVTDGGIVSAPRGQNRQPTEALLPTLAGAAAVGKWPPDGARALRRVLAAEAGGGATGEAREIVVLLTDLHEQSREISTSLAPFRAGRHELIVCHLVGRDELDFPHHGAVQFEDLETGAIIEADASAAHRAWTQGSERQVQAWRRAWGTSGRFEYVCFRLDEPPERVLRQFLRQRLRHR